ncbi:MAG: hypothetical protein WBP79_02000, partial [Candidatus Acidiferrales bacterium]
MRTKRLTIWATLLVVAMSVPAARAQQQAQDQSAPPIPAYRSPLASAADNGDDEMADPQKMAPDTRSLAGAQDLSIGVPSARHSYWQPYFNVTSTGGSNALSATGQSEWTTYTSLSGGVDLHRISGNSDLTLTYLGGGTVTNNQNMGNSVTQEFELAEKLTFRRSTISIFDQLNYIPETGFGYGGVNGLALPGGGSLGLQTGLLPGQSILTTRGQQLANSSIAQVDTYLNSRSSFTFVGGYSLLHFFDNDLLNSGDAIFQAGYNHQMSRQNTFAIFYRFSGYRYSSSNQSFDDNSFQLSFGRRVTGQLAFQIAGGPDVAIINLPLSATGPSGGSGSGTAASSRTQVYWSLSSSLIYQLRRNGFALSYNHGLGGGSGVLAGSVSDSLSGSVNRQLRRTLSGSFNLGYARNKALTLTTPTATSSQTFDYWFSGVNFSHPWGRALSLNLGYQLQYQNSNSSFCIGPTCGTSTVRHQ